MVFSDPTRPSYCRQGISVFFFCFSPLDLICADLLLFFFFLFSSLQLLSCRRRVTLSTLRRTEPALDFGLKCLAKCSILASALLGQRWTSC
jgi:hypothetical protein